MNRNTSEGKKMMEIGKIQMFNVGDKVVDLDGFKGVVSNVWWHDGHVGYDVRFDSGVAVRFNQALTKMVAPVPHSSLWWKEGWH